MANSGCRASRPTMIGLADCNNFFVSCERALDPSLCGKAVVVLSNNDGCAVARSNEAKKLGIRMGQPAFELRDLIRSGKLIAFSGNHILYREVSLRIHDIIRRFVPRSIDYSVDESFLDMEGIPEAQLPIIGQSIVDTCLEEERIPVTIGFSYSKTLAKIATHVGKKKDQRVVVLSDRDEIDKALRALPVNEIWGIGRRLAKRLYASSVYTAADFADRPAVWIRAKFGVNGEKSWRELHGQSCIELSHVDRNIQDSISETRTFPMDVDDFDYIRARIAIYCAHVSKRMRAMNAKAGKITVFLRSNRFHIENGYVAPEASARFEPEEADAARITTTAVHLLERIFSPGQAYKRAGVILSDIVPASSSFSLFDSPEQIETQRQSERLMKIVDALNVGVGPHVVKLAAQLTKGHIGHNDGYSSSFGAPSS